MTDRVSPVTTAAVLLAALVALASAWAFAAVEPLWWSLASAVILLCATTELVRLGNDSWFCALGALSGDTVLPLIGDLAGSGAGTFFIRAMDDRPPDQDTNNFVHSSEKLSWTEKD